MRRASVVKCLGPLPGADFGRGGGLLMSFSARMSLVGRVVARAFWGPRPQSVGDGVDAIVATLRGLGGLDEDHLGRWFDQGWSRRDSLRREIAVDADGIRPFLIRNQEDGHVFEELGWSFWAWNGAIEDDDALSFNCTFSVTSPHALNRVVFGLPPAWEQDLGPARQALDLVVRVWQPEQANVWDANHVDLLTADL